MRKIILSMMVSLDGYMEDADKEIDWHVWNEEMSHYMIRFFDRIDTIMFGRVTYQMMADFWPGPAGEKEDTTIADRMNNLPKIVFSKTLEKVEWGQWNNIRLVKEIILEEMKGLKHRSGKDLVIFGGADLASTFIHLNLIDEYQIIVNPVILGQGTSLFGGISNSLSLKLMGSQEMNGGNVVLYYEPKRNELADAIGIKLQKTTDQLLEILSSPNQEQLNQPPPHGGWTAAQIGEHLLKSYAVVKTLNGTTKPTKRSIDQKIKSIKEVFLDLDIKMDSPTAIIPTSEPIDKEVLINSLKKRIQQLHEVIHTKDLSETCEDYAIPEYGEFTRLEWVYFCLYHTQRHIHQLKNTVQKVESK